MSKNETKTMEVAVDTKKLQEVLDNALENFKSIQDETISKVEALTKPLADRIGDIEKHLKDGEALQEIHGRIDAHLDALKNASLARDVRGGPDGSVENRLSELERLTNLHKAKLHHM